MNFDFGMMTLLLLSQPHTSTAAILSDKLDASSFKGFLEFIACVGVQPAAFAMQVFRLASGATVAPQLQKGQSNTKGRKRKRTVSQQHMNAYQKPLTMFWKP